MTRRLKRNGSVMLSRQFSKSGAELLPKSGSKRSIPRRSDPVLGSQPATNVQSNRLIHTTAAFLETNRRIRIERGHRTGLRSRWLNYPQHTQLNWGSVIHKEPDHIDRNGKSFSITSSMTDLTKSARTALLVHLIMETPQPQIKSLHETGPPISASDLFMALEEKRNDFKADRWEIIKEIIRVREQIQMFRDGGFGKSSYGYKEMAINPA